MDPTEEFFGKLKKLAVTLESETERLQRVFDSRKRDEDTTTTAVRAYHRVTCDVGSLKEQIQDQLVHQKAKEREVNAFIKECRLVEERISHDILTLKDHWEKYGYQPPKGSQGRHESATEDATADESETKAGGEEEEEEEEGGGGSDGDEVEDAGGVQPASPLPNGAPPVPDMLQTPQLADFGLSEMLLKKGLAGSDWCPEEPPVPQIRHPRSFDTPGPPLPMPVTPKCALWLDDEEPQTSKLQEFGISETTLCLLNDFTMDLLKKNVQKPKRPGEDIPVPVNPVMESLQPKDDLDSPELPEFCALEFKIKKTKFSPDLQINGKPKFPNLGGEMAATPEVPALKTPYLKQLVSAKKKEPRDDGDSHVFDLPTPPRKGLIDSKHIWDCNVPQMSLPGVEEMPVMPHLESALKSPKMLKNGGEHEGLPGVPGLDVDGHTQEFNLGTPRFRRELEDPSTPEMPDLSSITQDICKLLSQAQLKKTAEKAQTDKTALREAVPPVSDSEFQSLPDYLKLMTLHKLNQAVHNINAFMADYSGQTWEFQLEELQRIVNAGAKSPVFILCLTELRRLTHIGGVESTVYKLNTHA